MQPPPNPHPTPAKLPSSLNPHPHPTTNYPVSSFITSPCLLPQAQQERAVELSMRSLPFPPPLTPPHPKPPISYNSALSDSPGSAGEGSGAEHGAE